jgi:beta-xylosidase
VVPLSVLAYTGVSGDLVMEPGPIELTAGSSSSDIRSTATVKVTGKSRVIRAEERAFLSVASVSA